MTADRWVHLFAGFVFLIAFLKIAKCKVRSHSMILLLIATGLGTWVPDWDLFLGIGYHRCPITHSFLPVLPVIWLVGKLNLPASVILGFAIGLSSHLFWDIVDYGNVQWIDGGNNDRLFLLANAVILIAVAVACRSRSPQRHLR